jgi:OPT family oligopeptide transporter
VFQILLVLSTQMLGYGIAGICRRWLVYPPSMIWPALLSVCTFLNTFHNRTNTVVNGWKISRYQLFMISMAGSFVWYFIPGLIIPALSTIAFFTWIFPTNVLVNQLFGMQNGMALLPLTLDWTQVTAFLGDPLVTPWSAGANIMISLILWIWIVCPILHFSNVWGGSYFPFSAYIPSIICLDTGHMASIISSNPTT